MSTGIKRLESIKIFAIYLDLLLYLVSNFANGILRQGFLLDHKVMPGNHIGDVLPIN